MKPDAPSQNSLWSCTDIVKRLQAIEPELRVQGVTGLYLFGSTVKGTRRTDSDLDFFYTVNGADQGLQPYAEVRRALQHHLPGAHIDLVSYQQIKDYVRPSAEAWSQRIFGHLDYALSYTDQDRLDMIHKDPLPLLDIIIQDLERIFGLTDGLEVDAIYALLQGDDLVESRIVLNLMNIINILKVRLPQPIEDFIRADWHPEKWRNMGDFRNVIAHEYFNLDLRTTATVISNELPVLYDLILDARDRWIAGEFGLQDLHDSDAGTTEQNGASQGAQPIDSEPCG